MGERERTLLFIFGTRPEAVKLGPVIEACKERSIAVEVVLTGQHRDLLAPFLQDFHIEATYNLGVLADEDLPQVTEARIREALAPVLHEISPALVVVQGDTTSAVAGALEASNLGIPVAHVEAGLRTFNLASPWPEEENRLRISKVASIHFAPTERARRNLLMEGIPDSSIYVTGNPGIDALLRMRSRLLSLQDLKARFQWIGEAHRGLVLATVHRRESIPEGVRAVARAILRAAHTYKRLHFAFLVHPNPGVAQAIHEVITNPPPSLHLLPPLDYETFLSLLSISLFVVTDSGGVQEEAPVFGKPVVCVREVTERPEGVEASATVLTGLKEEAIFDEIRKLLEDEAHYHSMAQVRFLYGDGHASERIAQVLEAYLREGLSQAHIS